ncbi:MAG: hypothetical protein LBS44_01915 [Deltaproteobacteria bacterium]|jgi:hypothetical protein|nr:hypothetical protein [Deltaproteobacteria bacterium]
MLNDAEGICSALRLKLPPDTVLLVDFKYEKFSGKPDWSNEDKRQELMSKALETAKNQLAKRFYEPEFKDEYPVVIKLAVGLVGPNDVAAEIY